MVAPDGTGGRQLSRTGGWPVWWPDQSRIAYWTVGPNGDQEIQVVPLKGGSADTLRTIMFTGTNHPFDISATGQLVRGDAVHLNTEVWLMEPGR